MDDRQFEKGTQYEIYIGIKDKDSYQEILSIDDFRKILVEICTEKEIAFSLPTQLGGYSHNKGYTTETSFRIIILGIEEKEVFLLGERLKKLINTDTIMITREDIEYLFM